MELNKEEYEKSTQKMVDALKMFDEAVNIINAQLAVLGEARHSFGGAIFKFTNNKFPTSTGNDGNGD